MAEGGQGNSVTLHIQREEVERLAHRALTNDEFESVCKEVGVFLRAELRMVTALVISDLNLSLTSPYGEYSPESEA